MTRGDSNFEKAALNRLAAERVRREDGCESEEDLALSREEFRKTVYELRVHQIELEMQNEELRRTQAELDASRARYYDLYDEAPVGYCTLSEKGLILEANLLMATLLGMPRSALIHQPMTRFVLAADQDIHYQHRKRVFESYARQTCELRWVRAAGPPFWVRLDATAAREQDGEAVCRVVAIDISERKRDEEEREKLRAELNHAQKMESVGRLAGGVAHEFNNMLGVIIGNAELAMDSLPPSDPARELLQEIVGAASRSAEVARQLLSFARKQSISPKVIALNEAIGGLLMMLRRLIGEEIELVWKPGAHLWLVKVDPTRLSQILANLCVNSRDAIAGEGRITIETNNVVLDAQYCASHGGAVPGEFVALRVSDTGCGMDQPTMRRLFEPFFTTKDVGKGTGLGLATIHGIVRQSNGLISVQSEPERGSVFTIHWPRHGAPIAGVVEEGDHPVPKIYGTETILLVEDEASVLRMSQVMLERLGYKVLAAATPGDALLLAETHRGRIDLILTDVIMPEMNGRDLAKRLLSQHPCLKLLVMSGYSATVIAEDGGLDADIPFLQKPFSMKELAVRVREVLGARVAPARLPTRAAPRP